MAQVDPEAKTYDQGFAEWKEKRVNDWESSPYLCAIKKRVEEKTARAGQGTQTPFTIETMDQGCAEWGWANDATHWAQVIVVCQDFMNRKLGFKFRIRDVVDANLLSDHHGIGDRHEDVKNIPQYCGVLLKTFDAAFTPADKDGKKQLKEMKAADRDVAKYRVETAKPKVGRAEDQSDWDPNSTREPGKRNWWGGNKGAVKK